MALDPAHCPFGRSLLVAKSGAALTPLMGSSSSLLRVRSRARVDANLRPTPPSFDEMQVSKVVGDGDEQADARRCARLAIWESTDELDAGTCSPLGTVLLRQLGAGHPEPEN